MDLIFKGITNAQAIALANWYAEQGEQDASFWFEGAEENLKVPLVDVSRRGGHMTITQNEVIVYCK